ncbi:hypothetical protein MKW94_006738 [Papaver nudicaule]|uniref:F-box associated beta-propeller type 1 domain-containing protein n=1 Tax=Papaver nudicaule TaxID=74823 RepID=A0AA41V044_PAPNU|nr:hypothetical protein [Papaver nudicaule]
MYLVKGYSHRNIHIHVYSLKSNSWRTVKNTPYERPSKNPVFFEGFFHWVDDLRPGPKQLSCFDTVNGTVKHILLPQHFQHKFKVVQACLLGGRLCVTAKVKQNIREVWTMKDYGVAESWTIMYSNHKIPQNLSTSKKNKMNYLRLQRLEYFRQCFKNAAVLVYPDDNATYLYDLNHEEFRELKIDGISPSCKTWAFFGSLVSPNLGSCLRVQ